MNPTILNYYTPQSPITDPGPYAHLYDNLPDGVHALVKLIQGQMMHRNAAEHYGVTVTSESRNEMFLRTMQQRLERIAELSSEPLTVAREPRERQVGKCRDFAVFLVSLLRHKGIPARMRVGFAEYLYPDQPFKADHWITEYWDASEGRWLLVDPDVGGLEGNPLPLPPGCDLFDLRRDKDFFVAGSAWRLARTGKLSSTLFRYSGRWKGFPRIRGDLLHDFQALNRLELALYDYWDDLHRKSETSLTVEDKALLDRVADLTADPDAHFDDLRAYFDALPRTQRLYAKLRQLGVIEDAPLADAGELQLSGAERLASLSKVEGQKSTVAHYSSRFLAPDEDTTPFETPDLRPLTFDPLASANTLSDIFVRGARQHNLKHINVRIPRNKLVVITGVSGSGKSSLAFDTIYAEGQRRYVESLSSFARQFMDQMEKPQVDQITGLSPAIAIEQKTIARNPRSTVGTVTEILDYLRVLYARLGTPHCPQCGRAVQPQSAQQITNQLASLPPGTRFQLLAPIARNRKGTFAAALKAAVKDGYARARVDGQVMELTAGIPELDKDKKHNIELIIDRLIVPDPQFLIPESGIRNQESGDFSSRLMDSVETSLRAGQGLLLVLLDNEELLLSKHNACPHCEISFPKLEPHLFSFNSPLGMCDECNGLGAKLQVDVNNIIVNPNISLLHGASRWHGDVRKKSTWHMNHLKTLAEHYGVDISLPWKDLPQSFRDVILYGSGDEKIHWQYENAEGTFKGEGMRTEQGTIHHINRLFRQTKSEYTKRWYISFMSQLPCPKCSGERLNPEARFVTVGGKRLPELTSWSIENIHDWVSGLDATLNEEQREIGLELITEIRQRLGFYATWACTTSTWIAPLPRFRVARGSASAWPARSAVGWWACCTSSMSHLLACIRATSAPCSIRSFICGMWAIP
jgi:excinuclease ABC subunit A